MGRKAIDLTGKRFGRLVVLERAGSGKIGARWLCQCDCGKTKVADAALLKRGSTSSCGCIATELRIKNFTGAHRTHGGTGTRLYYVWRDILNRCEVESSSAYRWYGAVGVTVCEEWHDFSAFRSWAIENGYDEDAPRGKCTIDRIDPFGNYEPSNCRWVDMKTQSTNRRSNHA